MFVLKQKKVIYIFLGILLMAVCIFIGGVLYIEYAQLKHNKSLLHEVTDKPKAKTLVVYFSRSGNTELMAHEIAKAKNTNLLTIQSDDYRIGLRGWINALKDARDTVAQIRPQKIDLSAYDTIFIGSPIWLYSPAPPIWEFARVNDFEGKSVVLFNSMNSKFEQGYIDNFGALIEKQGGKMTDHLYVIRGRMTQQMELDEFLNEVRRQLKK